MMKGLKRVKYIPSLVKGVLSDTIGMVKGQIEVRSRFKLFDDVVRVGDFEVIHDHALVRARGSKIAFVIYLMGRYYYVVDDLFFTLSADAQLVVLYHERGHVECGHLLLEAKEVNKLQGNRLYKAFFYGEVSYMELEADAYAVSVVGVERVVLALYEVMGLLEFTLEFELRVSSLLNN